MYDGPGDGNSITIFDKDNKQVYYNDNVKTGYYGEDDYDYNFEPFVSNGKLHVIVYDIKDC